jgi:hypothetical protein
MTPLSCCAAPFLDQAATDLGHADSFEFMLSKCCNCGSYWLHVFCVATSIADYEPVSDSDAAAMLATSPGKERKHFMSNWAYEHL